MATDISKLRFRPKDHSQTSQCPRSAYTYKPLQTTTSIRVLKISPLEIPATASSLDDLAHLKIKASLVEVDLDDAPVFNALSYTWGDPMVYRFKDEEFLQVKDWYCQCYSIECDGQVVTVGANLFSCLFELRFLRFCGSSPGTNTDWKELLDRPIWIDALCINQNDPDEKTTQIPLMGRIYSQSKHTMAYLGGADDASVTAMPFVQSFAQAISEYKKQTPDGLGGVAGLSKGAAAAPHLTGEIMQRHNIPVIPSASVPHVYAFLHRAWFMRTWVMQEIALSEKITILCGGMSMDLWDLRSFYWHTSEITGLTQIPTVDEHGNLEDCRHEGWASLHIAPDELHCREGKDELLWFIWTVALFIQQQLDIQKEFGTGILYPRPLSQLIAKFRLTGAADPRDRIYGVLSLEGEGWRPRSKLPRPPLDYSKPLGDVYVEWTRYILQAEQDLAYLSLAHGEFDRDRGYQTHVPSWVPNLVEPVEIKRPVNLDVLGIGCPFSTGRAVGPLHISFPDDSTIQLRGRRIDEVLEVAGFEGGTGTLFDHAHILLDLPTYTWVPNVQSTIEVFGYHMMSFLLKICTQEVYDKRMAETEERADGGTFQSRHEVYWRTLLMDQCDRRHPAPEHAGPVTTEKSLDFLAECLLESVREPENASLFQKFLCFLDVWVDLHRSGELRPAEEFTEETINELVVQLAEGPIDRWIDDDELEQYIGARSARESLDHKLKNLWLLPFLENRGFIVGVDGDSIYRPNMPEANDSDESLMSLVHEILNSMSDEEKQGAEKDIPGVNDLEGLLKFLVHVIPNNMDDVDEESSQQDPKEFLKLIVHAILIRVDDGQDIPGVDNVEEFLTFLVQIMHDSGDDDEEISLEQTGEPIGSDENGSGRSSHGRRTLCLFVGPTKSSPKPKVEKIDRKDVKQQIQHTTGNKALIRLGNGLLGLADAYTQAGDEVWALAGSRVPFTLRKEVSDGSAEPRYRLIGDAYVHGVMHGDVIEAGKMDDAQFVHIV